MRSGPFDDVPDRELAVRSAAVLFAGLGLVLSAIGGVMVWLVLTFPVGAASDIAGEAVTTAVAVHALEACRVSGPSVTTTAPPAGPPTTPTTLSPECASLKTALSAPSR